MKPIQVKLNWDAHSFIFYLDDSLSSLWLGQTHRRLEDFKSAKEDSRQNSKDWRLKAVFKKF